MKLLKQIVQFLLTRPMRGATRLYDNNSGTCWHFYSHAPCGARHQCTHLIRQQQYISTHTPHAGRDHTITNTCDTAHISTHTPHAGRDDCPRFDPLGFDDFYSHAPCGARRIIIFEKIQTNHFYSHAPCGARRVFRSICAKTAEFLLTRPMRGATRIAFTS